MADTPDAIPAFATAARSAILAPMPKLKINATQPWLISQPGNVAEITRRFTVVDLALRRTATSIPTSATRVSANLQPRDHLAGLLRSERQLLANSTGCSLS